MFNKVECEGHKKTELVANMQELLFQQVKLGPDLIAQTWKSAGFTAV